MDYGTYRGILTLIILVLFVAIVCWAYSKGSKKRFDEASNAIFDDDKSHDNTISNNEKGSEK